MDDTEILKQQLQILKEAGVISEPEQNLRSKVDSLVRSIENLSAKKLRIEYEIKKQKRSLARKRMELKKGSKHSKAKLESALESGLLIENSGRGSTTDPTLDYLLRESARILDSD